MDELRCLLDVPGLLISYDAANAWLYLQWRGEHDVASVHHHTEHLFACLAMQPCRKVLSDHSMRTGNWRAAPPRGGQPYFERLAAQGVAYLAWVYSFSFSDYAAMEQALSYTSTPVVGLFDDVASAYDWLRRCQ